MSERIEPVGMGEIKFGDCEHVLAVFGLGSCVALALFDPSKGHGAMCHIVLPEADKESKGPRYANIAFRECLSLLQKRGSDPKHLKAKIVGGANLFPASKRVPFMDIGPKNVQAVKKLLGQASISLVGADVGGNKGRTVMFRPHEGKLWVRRTGEQEFCL